MCGVTRRLQRGRRRIHRPHPGREIGSARGCWEAHEMHEQRGLDGPLGLGPARLGLRAATEV